MDAVKPLASSATHLPFAAMNESAVQCNIIVQFHIPNGVRKLRRVATRVADFVAGLRENLCLAVAVVDFGAAGVGVLTSGEGVLGITS